MIEYAMFIFPLYRFSMLRSQSLENTRIVRQCTKKIAYFADLFPFCGPCSLQFTYFLRANERIQSIYAFTRRELTTFRRSTKVSSLPFRRSSMSKKKNVSFFRCLSSSILKIIRKKDQMTILLLFERTHSLGVGLASYSSSSSSLVGWSNRCWNGLDLSLNVARGAERISATRR